MKRVSAIVLTATAFAAGNAAAVDYPEEYGVVPSAIPPSPDESGLVRNVPAWRSAASGNTVDDFFARYDTNRDGVISWNEAQADPDLARAFTRADANNDGALSRAEFGNAAIIAYNERRSGGG